MTGPMERADAVAFFRGLWSLVGIALLIAAVWVALSTHVLNGARLIGVPLLVGAGSLVLLRVGGDR